MITAELKRNEGSICNPDYIPDEDPDIIRLRKLADEHPAGEPADLTDDEWMLLLDNDVATFYRLRGDDPNQQNPHALKFPSGHDVPNLPAEQYDQTDWLRLLKWDVAAFNDKHNEWRESAEKDEDGNPVLRIDLRNGNLASAFLYSAYLPEVNLKNANLSGADMTAANLSGAELNSANLSNSNLSGANLSGAGLINANLSIANLDKANISNARLSKADLTSAGLSKVNLSGSILLKANLSGARLGEANLTGANLKEANLSNAILNSADLSNAVLSKANLSDAFLFEANLSGARFGESNLEGAHLGQAILKGADLKEANLSGAELAGAEIDSNTTFDPLSLRGADCRDIQLTDRNFRLCNDAVNVDFDGCRFHRLYFRSSILGKFMLREKAYEWGLQQITGRTSTRTTKRYELDTCKDEKYHRIYKFEPELKFSQIVDIVQQAGDTYLNLKANWQDIGYYDDASWAAVREKECERKAAYALVFAEWNNELDDEAREKFNNKRPIGRRPFIVTNLLKWVGYSIFNALCQYGENPLRLAYFAAGIIILFSFLYPITGVNATIYSPGEDPAIHEAVIKYTLNTTVGDTMITAGRFFYHSAITFTTVGYGDFHPVGLVSHAVAIVEAFIGVFLVGLFIWCLGKRVGAR